MSYGDGKDQKPLGESAHGVGVSVVGHCCVVDDVIDAASRDVGRPTRTLLEVRVCRAECDIERGTGKICNECIRRMKFKIGLMGDPGGVERYIR